MPFLLTGNPPTDIIKSMSAKTVQAQKCFVCGLENPHGLGVPFIFEGGRVRAEFTPDDSYCGFDGIVHAGILFALADEAMMHLIHGNQVKAITSEVTLRLKKFARTNSKLEISADSLETGNHLVTCRAAIYDAEGKTICTAQGKFLYYTDKNPFKKSGL